MRAPLSGSLARMRRVTVPLLLAALLALPTAVALAHRPGTDGGQAAAGCTSVFGPSIYVGVTHVPCDVGRPVVKQTIRHPLQHIPGWNCTYDRPRTTGHCHRIGSGGIVHWTPGDPPTHQVFERDDLDGHGTALQLDIAKPGDRANFGAKADRAHVFANQWFVQVTLGDAGTAPLPAPCTGADQGFFVDTGYRWFYVLDRHTHRFNRTLRMTAEANGLDGSVAITARPGARGIYHGTLRIQGTLKGCATSRYDSGPIEFIADGRGERL